MFHLRAPEAPDGVPLVVFAGRSNAGKSSVINALCGGRFARVSRDPGRTRMINLFNWRASRFWPTCPDTVTLKFRTRSGHLGRRLWIDFCVLRKFCGMVIIVDCRRGLGNLDLLLLDGFVARPVLVILSKADKINREKLILAQRKPKKR